MEMERRGRPVGYEDMSVLQKAIMAPPSESLDLSGLFFVVFTCALFVFAKALSGKFRITLASLGMGVAVGFVRLVYGVALAVRRWDAAAGHGFELRDLGHVLADVGHAPVKEAPGLPWDKGAGVASG